MPPMNRWLIVCGILVLLAMAAWLASSWDDTEKPMTGESDPRGEQPGERESPPGLKGVEPALPVVSEEEPDAQGNPEVEVPESKSLKEAPQSRIVTVRAEDSQGQPVKGIEILGHFTKEGGGLSRRPLGRTAGDGSLTLDLPMDRVILSVGKHERWHCNDVIVVPEKDLPDSEHLVFRLVELVTISGRVLTMAGTPSAGSRIQAFYRDRSSTQGTPAMRHAQFGPTGADGRFTMRLPPYVTQVRMIVFIQGGGLVQEVFEIRPGVEVVVQPRKPIMISGVVEGPNGEAVESFDISAVPPGDGNGGLLSRHENKFTVMASSPGRYVLLVTPHAAGLGRPDPIEVEAPIEGVRVVCPKGATLSGTLQGKEVGGFRVFWTRHRGEDRRLRVEQEVKSNADGAFTLGGLREGETLLYAFRDGDDRYALQERVSLPATKLKVPLQRGLAIKGRVADYTGRHGFDLGIGASWRGPTRWGIVQDDGTFVIAGLPPGRYGLRWWRDEQQEAIDREVEPGGAAIDVSLPEEALSVGAVPPK